MVAVAIEAKVQLRMRNHNKSRRVLQHATFVSLCLFAAGSAKGDGKVFGGADGVCTSASPAIANAIGRLTQVRTNASIASYTGFDQQGRITSSKQETIVDGVNRSYSFSAYTYYPTGRLKSVIYPSGNLVSYNQTSAGRVASVKKGATNSADSYASNFLYSPHGGATSITLGNQVVETRSYNSLLQLTSLNATKGGALLSLSFDYGSSANNGNLKFQTITVPGGSTYSQSYEYDSLNRLSWAKELSGGAQLWRQDYKYDRFGNRAILVGSYLPFGTETPQVANEADVPGQFTNNRWSKHSGGMELEATHEDGTGNIIVLGTKTFAYDNENRMISANAFGKTASYAYDGEGRRVVKKVGSDASTVFVYDAMGKLAAEYGTVTPGGCGRCYLTADALGSTRMVTDAAGNVFSRYDYLPFGEGLLAGNFERTTGQKYGSGSGDANSVRFTGKERDSETGLDFMEVRYFSGAQGRFTRPDEPFADQNEADPQSWNLYSYVRNNPLRFIDPSGRDCVNLDNGTQGDDGKGTVCTGAQLGTGGNLTVGVGRDEANFIMLQEIGKGLSSPHQIATIVSEAGQGAMLFSGFASLPSMARRFIGLISGPKLIQLGLKGAAEAANAAAAVDVANLSNKIVRQMAMRGWTSAQEIVETIQKGQGYPAVNKATGGAATEWVNQATGKFVVVDNTTNQVIQVSRPGMLPNHLLP